MSSPKECVTDYFPSRTNWTFDSIEISSEFDSGNCARAERVTSTLFNLWTAPDAAETAAESGCRTWFHFRVKGVAKGQTISFAVKNLNNQPRLFRDGLRPVYKSVPKMSEYQRIQKALTLYQSTDNGNFEIIFQYEFEGEEEEVYFAFCFPWSYQQDREMLDEIMEKFKEDSDIYVNREVLTRSKEDRDMDLLFISSHDRKTEEREKYFNANLFPNKANETRPFVFEKKPSIILTSRVHPGETGASYMMKGALDFLLSKDDPRAIELRKNFIFYIITILNPDGVSRGHYRHDTKGLNLNRFYLNPTHNEHPTIYANRELIMYCSNEKKLQIYVDLHGHASKRGVFLFGNCLDYSHQIDNILFAKLMQLNCVNFDFEGCNFTEKNMRAKDKKDGLSREGSGRVAMYKATSLNHCYTLEANYYSGRVIGAIPPIGKEDYVETMKKYGLDPILVPEAMKKQVDEKSEKPQEDKEEKKDEDTENSDKAEGESVEKTKSDDTTDNTDEPEKKIIMIPNTEEEKEPSKSKNDTENEDDDDDEDSLKVSSDANSNVKAGKIDAIPESDVRNRYSAVYENGPPAYTPEVLEQVGEALCVTILDVAGKNPISRVKNSKWETLQNIRTMIAERLLTEVPYRFDPLVRKILKEVNRAKSDLNAKKEKESLDFTPVRLMQDINKAFTKVLADEPKGNNANTPEIVAWKSLVLSQTTSVQDAINPRTQGRKGTAGNSSSMFNNAAKRSGKTNSKLLRNPNFFAAKKSKTQVLIKPKEENVKKAAEKEERKEEEEKHTEKLEPSEEDIQSIKDAQARDGAEIDENDTSAMTLGDFQQLPTQSSMLNSRGSVRSAITASTVATASSSNYPGIMSVTDQFPDRLTNGRESVIVQRSQSNQRSGYQPNSVNPAYKLVPKKSVFNTAGTKMVAQGAVGNAMHSSATTMKNNVIVYNQTHSASPSIDRYFIEDRSLNSPGKQERSGHVRKGDRRSSARNSGRYGNNVVLGSKIMQFEEERVVRELSCDAIDFEKGTINPGWYYNKFPARSKQILRGHIRPKEIKFMGHGSGASSASNSSPEKGTYSPQYVQSANSNSAIIGRQDNSERLPDLGMEPIAERIKGQKTKKKKVRTVGKARTAKGSSSKKSEQRFSSKNSSTNPNSIRKLLSQNSDSGYASDSASTIMSSEFMLERSAPSEIRSNSSNNLLQ